MLIELAVANLGVIDQVTLQLPPGMIALTGETGAGKTLMVDAINLLVGGRADPGLVRPGAEEATVDGRFTYRDAEGADAEVVLSRVIPAQGRSRAYVDGRPASISALAEWGTVLVDLHGQHDHQSLLGAEAQRDALDAFGLIDRSRLQAAVAAVRSIEEALSELGGDARTRARELDLVRYQVDELVAASLDDPAEDELLERREDELANAVDHREAAAASLELIVGDNGARDQLGEVSARLDQRGPFMEVQTRVTQVLAEVDDLADELRSLAEQIDLDPAALAEVQERRALLHQLCRKYGDDLGEVIAEREVLIQRLEELETHDERAAALDAERAAARSELALAQRELKKARQNAAPKLADAIQKHLPELAMEKARVGVEVDGDDGGHVVFQLAANPGAELQPLGKVASGGELSRTMLALRSVLSKAPPILVFDEVDAGIGGEAGIAVGRALAALADRHQVVVVTHLPQVAAFADTHLFVHKAQKGSETTSDIRPLGADERQRELARMLSGQPDSDAARHHAEELLAMAAELRRGS